jgi:hypothetical protein
MTPSRLSAINSLIIATLATQSSAFCFSSPYVTGTTQRPEMPPSGQLSDASDKPVASITIRMAASVGNRYASRRGSIKKSLKAKGFRELPQMRGPTPPDGC